MTTRLEAQEFIRSLDQVIDRCRMLKHPFYQSWNEGRLSIETVAEYAKQYYFHVRAFPTYVSAVHSRSDDIAVRQMLLENLIEEEMGPNNHPELWLRFAEGLGLARAAVRAAEALPETLESVEVLRSQTQSKDFRSGVAALYAYESQIPEVARTKREGLARFYGISDPRAVAHFRVHEDADRTHSQVERNILVDHCVTGDAQDRALRSAEASARALWTFLDGCYRNYASRDLAAARAPMES